MNEAVVLVIKMFVDNWRRGKEAAYTEGRNRRKWPIVEFERKRKA